MENQVPVKDKAKNLWKKYWDVESGLSHPAKSIKRIAKIFYYFYLVLGLVGAVGCLISFFDNPSFAPILMVFLTPLICKFLGWISTLGLSAVAVVVESHEKHLEEYNKAE